MALSIGESRIVSHVSIVLTFIALLGCLFLLITRCISIASAYSVNHSSLLSLSHLFNISRIPLFLIVCDTAFAILSCYYHPVIEFTYSASNCEVFGPLTQFFSISAFIWATAITSTSFKVINKTLEVSLAGGMGVSRRGSLSGNSQYSRNSGLNDRNILKSDNQYSWSSDRDNTNLITKSYLFMALIIPIFSALIMVIISESHYGDYNRVSCWLSFNSGKNELLKYYFFVLFVYIIPLLVMEVYCLKILYNMWKMFNGSPYRHSSITKLFSYLIIIIGTKGLLLISRCVMVSRASTDYTFAEVLFMAVIYPLQGLGDILIFIINESDSGVISSWLTSSSRNVTQSDSPITIYSSAIGDDSNGIQNTNRIKSCAENLELIVSFSNESGTRRAVSSPAKASSMYSTLNSSSHSGVDEDDDDIALDDDIEEEIDFGNHERSSRSHTSEDRSQPLIYSKNSKNNNNTHDKNDRNEAIKNPMFL